MMNYADLFLKLENTLKQQSKLSEEEFAVRFGKFKTFEDRVLSDDDYYNLIVEVVFHSGIKANIIIGKMDTIKSYFNDYKIASSYGKSDIDKMMNDKAMIKNKKKINACIHNAIIFKDIISEHGSFKAYIDNFNPLKSFENLLLFKEELDYKFKFFGDITSYHFMTDIGLPVLKPDRVITRLFERLSLIENRKQTLKTVLQGRKFSEETGHPLRYVDICLVKYGQSGIDVYFELDDGICLEKNPKCDICGIREYCNYI